MTNILHTQLLIHAIGTLAAALSAETAHTQVYRSVDIQGRVVYSDQPISTARTLPIEFSITPVGSSATQLPYKLSRVATRYPVAIYTQANCAPCDQGRTMLIARGIPFQEKIVQSNADVQALQALTHSNQLPVLTIGRQRLIGFTPNQWVEYLDAAGYPKTPQLPTVYRRPRPRLLTEPPPLAKRALEPTQENAIQELNSDTSFNSRPTPNPAGIRF